MFLSLPDPRDPSGRRHPLAAMLTLAVTAILAGAKTLTDIAEFGRRRRKLCRWMGFIHKPPCISTFHYFFKRLDAEIFEHMLQEWLQAHFPQEMANGLHIDGKTLCGSRRGEIPGVHLLAAYSNSLGTSLMQIPVDAKTNEHKAALELLHLIPMKGALITGDAMFAQREIVKEIIDEGGEYLLTVKDNQPSLKQALLDAFDAPISPSRDCGTSGGSANSHYA
jgi:hypothetical protein